MKRRHQIVFDTLAEGEAEYAAGERVRARDAFEYVRAAIGNEGLTQLVDGELEVSLAHVLNMLLACAQPLQDWEAMKELAAELVALEPEDCDPWIRFSIGLKHLGELSRATEAILHAIELDPDDSNARYEHACQLAVAGDLEAALERVAEAVARGARRTELLADDELAALRELPRFRELMKKR